MIVAKVQGKNLLVAEFSQLYPAYWQFNGLPPEDFMQANNLYFIQTNKSHDASTQKLEFCAPYLEGNAVYGVRVVDLTQEEIDARAQSVNVVTDVVDTYIPEPVVEVIETTVIESLTTASIEALSTTEVSILTTVGL